MVIVGPQHAIEQVVDQVDRRLRRGETGEHSLGESADGHRDEFCVEVGVR